MMKLLGAILVIIGGYLGFGANPLFFIASAIGLLFFLQGVENAIIENTTEYVRRAIVENKTYEELENERLSQEPEKVPNQSEGKWGFQQAVGGDSAKAADGLRWTPQRRRYDGGKKMEKVIPHLVILVVVITIMVWSLLMQRKAVARQKEAMQTQRDAVDRQKEAMVQVEESLTLNRKQVENQEKIIALLEQIRDRKTS
jgi:hypothetical protein